MENKNLEKLARGIRKEVVLMAYRSGASHTGSALSIVDILVFLYFEILNVFPLQPENRNRDRFILSKGHASAALYAVLAEKGFFDKEILNRYYCRDGILPGHLDKDSVPGIEISSGSLGHGIGLATGIAIVLRNDNINARTIVLMGDGELNEGSVWEALMFIPTQKLTRLTIIIDKNNLQGFGETMKVLPIDSLSDRLRSFNWEVREINGHSFTELRNVFNGNTPKPLAIIANTIKGKGVSFMENQFIWHYKSPDKNELEQALKELE